MDLASKKERLERLTAEAEELRREIAAAEGLDPDTGEAADWPPKGSYFTYEVMAGLFLGLFGALASLVFNVIGAQLVDPPAPLTKHPLNLIRVFLTFPLGDDALEIDDGVALAVGCFLYLGTGMLLGIPFHLIQCRLMPKAGLLSRIVLATVLGLAIWVINFYGILSWLQPLLFQGNWIVRMIPPWVAAATHVVFGWTMAIVYPFGVFVPYQPVENAPGSAPA
jgi:hypothetical protein